MTARDDRRIAADPTTAPGVLDGLAINKDCKIRAMVAANPNADLATLGRLANEVPGEVLRNPALSLLVLEGPQALQQLSFPAISVLATHAQAPLAFVMAVVASSAPAYIKAHIASKTTHLPALERLADQGPATVRGALVHNRATPQELLERLLADPSPGVWTSLVRAKRVPDAMILKGLDQEVIPAALIPERTAEVVASDRMTEDQLAELAHSRHAPTRRNVAQNVRTPFCVLTRLARDPNEQVRRATVEPLMGIAVGLGRDRREAGALMHALARDASVKIRSRVAGAIDRTLNLLRRKPDRESLATILLLVRILDRDGGRAVLLISDYNRRWINQQGGTP